MTLVDKTVSREGRIFAEKAARSIIEVQDNIENVTDIFILLEISGITKEDLEQNGFNDMYDLAMYVNTFIEFYEVRQNEESEFAESLTEVPSQKKKLMESLAMTFPWLGSLAVFFVSGVSLWMVSGLPPYNVTALMIGVFLGIFISEGPLAVFQRFFVMNYSQLNTSEAKRTVKRNIILISLIAIASASILLFFGYLENSPTRLVVLSIVSLATVSLHRASYMIIYAHKKLKLLVVSYSIALALLLVIYSLTSNIIHDIGNRYLLAVGVAFLWLFISSIYAYHKAFSSSSTHEEYHPHFYKSPAGVKNTIKPRIIIQLWDALPYYIFGSCLFVMMFGDRLISWFFNPALQRGERLLPLLFNTPYHSGADPAMLVFAVTSVAQYMIMAGFYQELSNITVIHGITQIRTIDEFLQKRYRKLMLFTIVTSCCVAVILNLIGPELMTRLGASHNSLNILALASIGNVFLSIFIANSMFATFANRMKIFAIIALFSTLILGIGGVALAQVGFQNIVYAYLASALVSALLSSLYIRRIIKSASSIYFSRFT